MRARAVRNKEENRRSSADNLGEDALRQPRTVENEESDRCTESHCTTFIGPRSCHRLEHTVCGQRC